MVDLGRAGRGQSYYGQTVEDLEDPLGKNLIFYQILWQQI